MAKFLFFLACLCAALPALHLPVSRIFKSRQPQTTLVALILACQPLFLAAVWFFILRGNFYGGEMYSALAYSLVFNFCAGYIYFIVFSMGETARRIKILNEISRRGTLPEPALESIYGGAEVIGKRLERLAATGQLSFDGQTYRLRGKLLYAGACIVDTWGNILGIEQRPARLPCGGPQQNDE